jgi:hypothetical protein
MSENLNLKSIYELLHNDNMESESFFIPSYQRGYIHFGILLPRNLL